MTREADSLKHGVYLKQWRLCLSSKTLIRLNFIQIIPAKLLNVSSLRQVSPAIDIISMIFFAKKQYRITTSISVSKDTTMCWNIHCSGLL